MEPKISYLCTKTTHVLHPKCFDGGKFDFILNLVGRDILVYMKYEVLKVMKILISVITQKTGIKDK
jgi:hypothetical protein